jgi:hypothetical protein
VFRKNKDINTEGITFVCLQLSVLQRTNLIFRGKHHLVRDWTVLWCDGRTGQLLQLHQTVCLQQNVNGSENGKTAMMSLMLSVRQSPERLMLTIKYSAVYLQRNNFVLVN